MDARRLINTPTLHKNIYKQLKTNNVDYFFSLFFKPRDVFTFIRINIPARCSSHLILLARVNVHSLVHV